MRLPMTAIAERINSTPAVVKHCLEKLEAEKVIAAYRLDINLERLGITFFKVQLYLRD